MNSTLKNLFPLSHILILLFLPLVRSKIDYNSIIFTKCTNQTHTYSSNSHSQTLSSLLQQLIPEFSDLKFFKSNAGDEKIGISGLYQCRGDLLCHNCVNTFPHHLSNNNMCNQAMAGRVQLIGCYFEYETDGFVDEERRNHELLHEICGEKKAVEGGFVETIDAAFLAMESDEEIWEKGFYEGDYEYVHIIAQCEGDLRRCDCSECVGTAVQIAQQDCDESFSGKIFLDKCSLSYFYNPDHLYPDEERKNGNDTGKKVAIFLGAAATLGAGFFFLKFMTFNLYSIYQGIST